MKRWFLICAGMLALLMFPAATALAAEKAYDLLVERRVVDISGRPLPKITVNAGIPAPVLRFREGDQAVIRVTNGLDEETSVHWHGLLLPGEMDGVPTFNGFAGIAPGHTFTYRFPLRQTGTYWYHAHSAGQEQDGLYGAILVDPKGKDTIRSERDYVVLLSDFTEEDSSQVIGNLKKDADYYATARRTLGDFWAEVRRRGFAAAWDNVKHWNQMRMAQTDLADVTGYTFLVNGKTPAQNWTALYRPGDRVRLRVINASAMSFFDVRIPGLTMDVVQADGQDVEPLSVDEFRIAPAETYDVVVSPTGGAAYTIIAEPIDRTGFALATLAPRAGMRGELPAQRERALLTMADMGMDGMEDMTMTPADMISGWAKTGAPAGSRLLNYGDLRHAGIQEDTRKPTRTIDVRLGGNMERYLWTINGRKFSDSSPIRLRYGERVRLAFTNETMMAHPMHLHGMFVQLENGQPAEKLPNKHTVIVPPGGSYSVLLTADEAGEWAFHCHLLYHMMAGMMTQVVVARLDAADVPHGERSPPSQEGPRHAH